MIKNKSTISIIAMLVLAAGLISSHIFDAKPVEAQVVHGNVSGYAWADSIGWISFNCTNDNSCDTVEYGVSASSTNGAISGYAWASSIGWISFQETTGCPSGPGTCGAYVDGVTPSTMTGYKAVKGWAKAMAGGGADSGGWDGWIQLDHNQANPITYSFEDRVFKGYAWGGPDVVGWISFNSTDTPSSVPYSVTGPGLAASTLNTLGPIVTAPMCDVNDDSYLEISALTNGNDGPNVLYSAYPVSSAGVVGAALPAGGLYYGGTQIIFRDYSATSSISKRYAIYAEVASPSMSTSTATSSLMSMPAGFSCTDDPNEGSAFTDNTFTLNPSTITPPATCTGTWNVAHDGYPNEVEAACSMSLNNQSPGPVSASGNGPLGVGIHTLNCSLRNIEDPDTVYDTLSISRRCHRNGEIIER